jgi:hypothetical protein
MERAAMSNVKRVADHGGNRDGMRKGADDREHVLLCSVSAGWDSSFFELGWKVNGGNSFHFNGVCHGILGSGENGMRDGI